VRDWAQLDGCDAGALVSAGADVDLVTLLAGAETKKEHYGALSHGPERRAVDDSGREPHPRFNNTWAPSFYDWMLAHARP